MASNLIELSHNVLSRFGNPKLQVGFPGETQEDFDELARFITEAKLDAVGIFGYSDEDKL